MKKLSKILFIVLFFGTLVLCNITYAKSLDSGIPNPKEYTKESVSIHIGQKIIVCYINENREHKITLNVIGVLLDRWDNTKFLLLGKTEFKNRVIIPIEKIILIEEIK